MDTIEIQSFLKKIHPQLEFNVYASNCIPMYGALPIYLVCNLDPDTKPGSHWVAIAVDVNGNGEYFDSYGRKPTGYHLNFMKRNCKKWIYNDKRLQNDLTSVCGEYCLVYLFFKFFKKSMLDFVNNFSNNTLCNDLLLRRIFKSIFL